MYEGLVKSLRWLGFMFPETHPAQDDANRMSNNIHLYCTQAADAIEELQQTVEQMKAMVIVKAQHTEMFDERDKQTLMNMAKSLPLQIIPNKDETPHWIPVTERLPDIGKDVLCFCRANIFFVLGWDGYHWHEGADRYYMSGFVTHWMPLPEPPKEE